MAIKNKFKCLNYIFSKGEVFQKINNPTISAERSEGLMQERILPNILECLSESILIENSLAVSFDGNACMVYNKTSFNSVIGSVAYKRM